VNQLRGRTLRAFRALDASAFAKAAEELWGLQGLQVIIVDQYFEPAVTPLLPLLPLQNDHNAPPTADKCDGQECPPGTIGDEMHTTQPH
jgi:hypothetical protein